MLDVKAFDCFGSGVFRVWGFRFRFDVSGLVSRVHQTGGFSGLVSRVSDWKLSVVMLLHADIQVDVIKSCGYVAI
jgi:hypothetical protein